MKIFVVTGQTATGKTKLAFNIAKKNKGDLINCDSRQIYKYLDVVTGKDIDKDWRFISIKKSGHFDIGYYQKMTKTVAQKSINDFKNQLPDYPKIWLYDIITPNQSFSSYDYVQCANYVIDYLLNQKKTPVIVGGSYFYLKHLLYGIETEKIPPDWNLRKNLARKKVKELQKILLTIDPATYQKLNHSDLNNPHRLIRKIEIASAKNQLPLKPSSRSNFSKGLFNKNLWLTLQKKG
jgi:tRNA dimethylallyltransferase